MFGKLKVSKEDDKIIGLILAILMITGFLIVVGYMFSKNTEGKYDLQLGICIGLIVAKVGTIYDYYFGSSKGSSDKNDALSSQLTKYNSQLESLEAKKLDAQRSGDSAKVKELLLEIERLTKVVKEYESNIIDPESEIQSEEESPMVK